MARKTRTVVTQPGVLPPATKDQVKAQTKAELVMDVQGRTAIALDGKTKADEVRYIPMDTAGCFVYYMPLVRFRTTYQHSQKDPAAPPSLIGTTVAMAARCYVAHMAYAGGSDEALEELGKLTTITSFERETIMKKNEAKKAAQPKVDGAAKAAKPVKEKVAKEPKVDGAAKAAKPVKEKVAKEPKAPKAAKEPKEPRITPATTFRELIMKGGLTDNQIFAAVQKKHPEVTKEKRPYVAWYRNDLRKRGENPPAQKKEKP